MKGAAFVALVLSLTTLVGSAQAKAVPFGFAVLKKQIPDATTTKPYNYSLCVPAPATGKPCSASSKNPVGGKPPYVFTAKNLPSGLTISANGTITGSPKSNTPIGLQHFTVCVKDTAKSQKCAPIAINVQSLADNLKKQAAAAAKAAYDKTPAGKICKEHPGWSKDDCKMVADDEAFPSPSMTSYWPSATFDMLVTALGEPTTTNISDYGTGVQYQYCWEWDSMLEAPGLFLSDKIYCYYANSSDVITSYN